MNKPFIVIFLTVVFIIGCSESDMSDRSSGAFDLVFWPVFRGDRNLSGVADVQIPDNPVLLWTFDTGATVVSSPVIGHGFVYIGSTNGTIFSLDLLNGSKKWGYDTKDDVEAPPLLVEKTLYIGNLAGSFLALDAVTGRLNWSYDIGENIMGSANWTSIPGSDENQVLVGSYDSRMYAFEADTGTLRWTYETDYYINGAPATDGTTVVFGGCDEMLHIVSVSDGVKQGEVWAGSYIAGSAALVDSRAYVGHYGGKLVCIDIRERNIVWEYGDRKSGGFFSSPAVGKDRVYIGSRDRSLHCVSRETGEKVWTFPTRGDVDSSPVLVKDKVVCASADGRLYIVNAEDGKEIWSYEIGASLLGCPAVAEGMIVIGAEDGRIYAFGEKK